MLPANKARIAGLAYLATFVTGFASLGFERTIIVRGDAVATAAGILGHPSLFHVAMATSLAMTLSYVVVTALFYEIFKPVNRSVSILAACFSLTGCAVGAVSTALQMSALTVLNGANFLATFTEPQRQSLAYLMLKLGGGGASLVFFAFYCLLIGWLVLRSTFMPRFVGVLMMIGGCGWMTFLWPPIGSGLAPLTMLPGIIGEAALTFWLLTRGVDSQRWDQQASIAAA